MDPYIGEIRVFSGNYAPSGWAFCNGQILPINSNQALFTIISNAYGGDGRQNFALPNLQGLAPMHQGTGPGLTPRAFATSGGASTVTLTLDQMPNHDHSASSQSVSNTNSPNGTTWANAPGAPRTAAKIYSSNVDTAMNPGAIEAVGGNQPHNNMQPYMSINFIIALEGIYPVKQS